MKWITPSRYRLIATILSCILVSVFPILLLFRPQLRRRLQQHRGYYDTSLPEKSSKRIWLHAASVGEVGLALNLVRALQRSESTANAHVVLSTMTGTGQRRALSETGNDLFVIHLPMDAPTCVKRALDAIRPDVLILLETELWPVLIQETHTRGTPIVLMNGRISPRSVQRYLKLQNLLPDVLQCIRSFSMIHQDDAERIISMGADPAKVKVSGNAKFDTIVERREMAAPSIEALRETCGFAPDDWIWVAGCTRKGEEGAVIEALKITMQNIPRLRLVWAPRHPRLVKPILKLLQQAGIPCRRRSELLDTPSTRDERDCEVIVLDTMGELFSFYGLAHAAFSGGSLVPKGGHNFLEIAVWGLPPIYGPSYEDFSDAHDLLARHDAQMTVSNAQEMARALISIHQSTPDLINERRSRVNRAMCDLGHASTRHIDALLGVIE